MHPATGATAATQIVNQIGLAVAEQSRILSRYGDRSKTRFWIITEGDRSVTTILLPEDY